MSNDRNQPCTCGSGLKTKKCHGDIVKIQQAALAFKEKMGEIMIRPENQLLCKQAAEDKMNELIEKEQEKHASEQGKKETENASKLSGEKVTGQS